MRLARARIRGVARAGVVEDEEDAALSAFDSFCQGMARGRYPNLADRSDLWRLLVVITTRKVFDQVRRDRAESRGGGRVVGEAALAGNDGAGGLDAVIGEEPTPELAAILVEEYECRLAALGDDSLRQVATLKMEGFTDQEVADRMQCSRRTIQRKLVIIANEWAES